MIKLLKPDLYFDSIYHIPIDVLKKRNINGIIIDLDNTITEWNNPDVSQAARDWFNILKANDFKVCLASNNSQDRVVNIAKKLGIPCIPKAGKPRQKAFKQALDILGTDNNTTAVIGDQIFTDILGGNRMKLFTILVVPIDTKEFIGTRLMRVLEKFVLKLVVNQKI